VVCADASAAILLLGSTVYVGGTFSSIAGQSRRNLAAVDVTTGSATAWNPSPDGPGVRALVVSGSIVYVAGRFSSIGGQRRNALAALDARTGSATMWNPNPAGYDGAEGIVLAIAVSGSGSTVYAAGGFASIGGQSRRTLAALDAATGNATAWDPKPQNLGDEGAVRAIRHDGERQWMEPESRLRKRRDGIGCVGRDGICGWHVLQRFDRRPAARRVGGIGRGDR